MDERYSTVYRRRRRVNTDEGWRVCYVPESEVSHWLGPESDERLAEAVLMLIEGNPNRMRQPVGWICDAVWAQGLVEYLQEPEDVRRALHERARAPAAS